MMERKKLRFIFRHRRNKTHTHQRRRSWFFSLFCGRRRQRSKQQPQCSEVSLDSPPSSGHTGRPSQDEIYSYSQSTHTHAINDVLDHSDPANVEASLETEDVVVQFNAEGTWNGVLRTRGSPPSSSRLLLDDASITDALPIASVKIAKDMNVNICGKHGEHETMQTYRPCGTSRSTVPETYTVNSLQPKDEEQKVGDFELYYYNESFECHERGNLFSGNLRFLEEEIVFFSEGETSGDAELSAAVRLSFDHITEDCKEKFLGEALRGSDENICEDDSMEETRNLNRKRRLFFADEIGLPLVELHMIGGIDDPYAMSRIVVLVLDPSVKKFEIMQGEYSVQAGPTVNDLLLQLPNFANQERFSKMEFTSLIGTYKTIRQFSTSDRLFDLKLVKREVTVAIPKGANAMELISEAAPILGNTKIMNSIKRATRVSRGLKYIKSRSEMNTNQVFNLFGGPLLNSKPSHATFNALKTVWVTRSRYYDNNEKEAHERNSFIRASMLATIGLVLSLATISS